MKVLVNGEQRLIDATTLAGALEALDYGEAKIATALNGEFVPARARAATRLKDGDRIEILAPKQGG
jgi:sulfur carrier protein